MPLCKELCTQEERDKLTGLLRLHVCLAVSFHLNLVPGAPLAVGVMARLVNSPFSSCLLGMVPDPCSPITLPRDWMVPRLTVKFVRPWL